MPADITVCLLSWKRPENIPLVLDSIAAQSVAATVFLWDNGRTPIGDPRVDWIVRSSKNVRCWPRWFMAAHATTDYVCTLDDDLHFGDRHVLRDGMNAAARLDAGQLVGPCARRLAADLSYSTGSDVWGSRQNRAKDHAVDIVKGRHVVAATQAIQRTLPLSMSAPPEDDIAVSGLLARGQRGQHVRPGIYGFRLQRFHELPAPHAICDRPGHLRRRDVVARRYFSGTR